jgi:hypothetical protein
MHAGTLDRRNVNKHIGAAVVLNDKAVAPLGIEEFNSTCGHQWPPYKKRAKALLPHTNHFAWVRISGFCVFLGEAAKAETASSGAITNVGYITMLRMHCNHSSQRRGGTMDDRHG